jgi:hypothetical protein
MKYYAGIGSREIGLDIEKELIYIGLRLSYLGYTLRSGGAKGSDFAFEFGNDCNNGTKLMPIPQKEIFLPWKNFNNSVSPLYLKSNYSNLELIASKIYPDWDSASDAVRRLHARNVQQILGEIPGTSEPSDFVVCYSPRPKNQYRGTMFGIELAVRNNIPVYNLISKLDSERFYYDLDIPPYKK